MNPTAETQIAGFIRLLTEAGWEMEANASIDLGREFPGGAEGSMEVDLIARISLNGVEREHHPNGALDLILCINWIPVPEGTSLEYMVELLDIESRNMEEIRDAIAGQFVISRECIVLRPTIVGCTNSYAAQVANGSVNIWWRRAEEFPF